ncbi:2-phospho-L-lactate guanylyltransferase [Microbacterium phosphatis]|uniref:2-phospho-L-lactate guanylyltransferase n=1 Tax=Microbacterium phosphatis TaxID=3140248 RepID=UPI00314037A8
MRRGWTLVVPVKGSTGKSRLAHPDRAELATAIALDTVEAARRATAVREVVVVTGDPVIAPLLEQAGSSGVPVRLIPDPGTGLNGAIAAGLGAAGGDRAVMLGDLPALHAADLDAALALASAHARSFVPDAEGSGTTLIAARAGETLEPAFGADSAARHAAAGHAPLDVAASSSLRRDVDTAEQLRAAAVLGLGPRTAALL